MGNFYVNYTLRGPSQQDVAAALVGRRARVTPEHNGCVVVFDEESDSQNPAAIVALAAKLSAGLGCPLLAVLNHDDDILWYQLYVQGKLVDEYDSTPGYFDIREAPSAPEGGDAGRLSETFGGDATAVEAVLRGSYVFAFGRHAALADALGISDYGVGTSFQSFDFDELPDGLAAEDVLETGGGGDGPVRLAVFHGEEDDEDDESAGVPSATDLYAAVAGDDAAAVRRLAADDCSVDSTPDGRAMLLHIACQLGNAAAAEALLDLGTDPNRRYTISDEADGPREARTAIMYASGGATVELLVSRGADPNVTTPAGVTPLMMATARSDAAAVEALLAAGANPNVKAVLKRDGEPWTARQWAESRAELAARLSGGVLEDDDPMKVIIRLLTAAE